MKLIILLSLCVVLKLANSKGDKVPPSFQAKLHQHLQNSRWFWKLTGSNVKTVHPVSFQVDVVSSYNVTKLSNESVSKGLDYLKFRECAAIQKKTPGREGKDGVYTIYPDGKRKKKVYCDMTTDGGGWTVIQKRLDGSTDFYRTWSEYKTGFGDPSKNYWIGNDVLHLLTKNGKNELRVDLQRFNGQKGFAKYSRFAIGDERSKYKLSVSGHSGSIRDSFISHSGMQFTTKDQDNDIYIHSNCAKDFKGAWWYRKCLYSNLNGMYAGSAIIDGKYNRWGNWHGEALQRTKMMIRRSG